MVIKKLVNFFYEMGQLNRVKRSGYWLLNIKDPNSVAEHSSRAAMIGYFLAKIENVDVNKVVLMCLFNDIHESRLNDLHKVGRRYIDFKEAESKAHTEQFESLGKFGDELLEVLTEYQEGKTKEANVAKDVDQLEDALEAKELVEIGYKDAQNWIDNAWKVIKTDSAKKLLKQIEKTSSNDWWRNLKKIER